jgi:hypothetical protein
MHSARLLTFWKLELFEIATIILTSTHLRPPSLLSSNSSYGENIRAIAG